MSNFCLKHGFKEMYKHMDEYPEYIIAVGVNERVILRNTGAAPDAKLIMIIRPEEIRTTQTRRKR